MSADFTLTDHADEVRGRLYVEVRRNGVLVDVLDENNLIVTGAKAIFANLLGGNVSSNSVTQIGFGTLGTAPVVGNTGLTGATVKAIDSVTYPTAGTVQFNFSLGTGDCNGLAISEFGLFTAGNVLVARRVRSAPLNKDTDISLTGNWQISF